VAARPATTRDGPDVLEQTGLGPVGQVQVQRRQHRTGRPDLAKIIGVQQLTRQHRLNAGGATITQQLMIT
jgi:hypothetical protein